MSTAPASPRIITTQSIDAEPYVARVKSPNKRRISDRKSDDITMGPTAQQGHWILRAPRRGVSPFQAHSHSCQELVIVDLSISNAMLTAQPRSKNSYAADGRHENTGRSFSYLAAIWSPPPRPWDIEAKVQSMVGIAIPIICGH